MPATLPTTLYAILFADDDCEFFDTERERGEQRGDGVES
jgi:hypothetical protein